MGQCQTCKNWIIPSKTFAGTGVHGYCTAIGDDGADSEVDKRGEAAFMMVADPDGGPATAALYTLPTFGCRLYEILPDLGPPGSVGIVMEN